MNESMAQVAQVQDPELKTQYCQKWKKKNKSSWLWSSSSKSLILYNKFMVMGDKNNKT